MTATAADLARRLRAAAARPVPAGSAAAFRVLFGTLAALAAVRTLLRGWVEPLYLAPAHHFTYPGLGWVQPWPGAGMYVHMAALAVLGVAIALGYHYRLAVGLYLVGFTYVELLDRALYLNHYYWITVAAGVMLLLPLGRVHSLDARRRGEPPDAVPAWVLWTLRGLVGMVYAFAGLAKLNPDWLLRGQPLAIWLPQDADLPLVGPLLAEHATALAVSWAVVAFELAIVPLLLWRRTRLAAYLTAVAFHVGTAAVLPEIGMFPWIMSAGALVFLAPDWPARLARLLRRAPRPSVAAAPRVAPAGRIAPAVVLAVALVELALPFRHLLYPGNVRWTEEGYRYSWRVMLTEKVGHAEFRVRDPASGREWEVSPAEYLTPVQERAMAVQPDMVLDTAHLIADDMAARGVAGVEVRADVWVSMHGRAARRLVDPDVDLAAEHQGLAPKDWIRHSS
jgi:vitamin K-dependent gamma-carboxylase